MPIVIAADMNVIRVTRGTIEEWGNSITGLFQLVQHVKHAQETLPSTWVKTKTTVHVADAAVSEAYIERDPATVAAVELGGLRTFVAVPMLKENDLVGAFALARQEVRPFTEKQIALITNFAAQAVIAIENARLLNELRQRTDDLSETLEQQTASARVLEVISRSALDLHAVFETVAESSVRLCEADRAFIFQYDGELLRVKAFFNASPELADWVREHPVRPGNHLAAARAALHRQTIHVPDMQVDPDYFHGGKLVEAFRTILAVPSDALLGVILIYRLEVQSFTAKQIALVETFADQAAIAIENTRLLQELRKNRRSRGTQQTTRSTRHRSSWRNRTHEQAASLPAAASG